MPKKIDAEKGKLFVDYFTNGDTASNATASAKKAGWTGDSQRMGVYLKDKYASDILKRAETLKAKNQTKLEGFASDSIDLLRHLMSESANDMCKLKSAERILDLAGYSSDQNINLNVEKEEFKKLDDQELAEKIATLSQKVPGLKKVMEKTAPKEEQNTNTAESEPKIKEKRVTH